MSIIIIIIIIIIHNVSLIRSLAVFGGRIRATPPESPCHTHSKLCTALERTAMKMVMKTVMKMVMKMVIKIVKKMIRIDRLVMMMKMAMNSFQPGTLFMVDTD